MMMSELNIWISVDIKIFNIEGRALTKLESSFIKSHIALSQFLFLFTNATQDLPLGLQSLDNLWIIEIQELIIYIIHSQ